MEEKVNNKLRPPCLGETPCLMYTHGSSRHKQFQTFYNFSTSRTSDIKSIPELRGKVIIKGYHDWLLLADCGDDISLSLFNLVTLKVINLPPLHIPNITGPRDLKYAQWAFTSPPDCHDCVLVLTLNNVLLVCSCRPAQPNSSWVCRRLLLEGGIFYVLSNLAVLNGVIYGFGTHSNTARGIFFSLNSDLTLTHLQFPKPDIPMPDFGISVTDKLVESCLRLYHIKILYSYDDEILAIVIFELDLGAKVWREIKSLDGRTFFLGGLNNTWCWGRTTDEFESEFESESSLRSGGGHGGIQGNCIYFCLSKTPRYVLPLVVYNLQGDSFLTLHPYPNLTRPCRGPVWVISEHQRFKLVEWITKVDINHRRCGPITCQNVELSRHYVRQESKFSELPLDVVELMSKCMHLFEYWNFRATSKAFRSLCPLPQCRSNSSLPLLLLFKDNGGLFELIDPCRHDSRFNVRQSSPDPFTVQFSNNGWLLTLVAYKSLQFFNLFTGLMGDYPPFEEEDEEEDLYFRSVAFSTNPTSSECLTVAMFGSINNSVVHIYYLQPGNEQWICYELDCQGSEFHPSTSTPIFHAGAFYFLDMRGYLGVFQLVDRRQPSWQVFNKPKLSVSESYVTDFCSSYLIKCEGVVYSVFMEKTGMWIRVFRFDHSRQHWIEIVHLGNHSLFISRASSLSMVSEDEKMRNRIYFPMLRGKNKIVFYSLDTRKYYSLGSDDSWDNLYDATEPSKCCWV